MAWSCATCRLPVNYPARHCGTCEADLRARLEPTLFDAPRPGDARRSDPLPSKQAAAANLTARQTQKVAMLRRFLTGPQTSRTLADITGGQVSRASKRLGEMRDARLIRAVNYERTPGGGTPVTVFALTDAGRRDAELLTRGAA